MTLNRPHCIIHPIPLFRTVGDKSRQTYRHNLGKPLALVNYVWFIEGLEEKILIDAGGSPEFFRKPGIALEDIQTIDSGLSKVGVNFNDIDLVILTHLHPDHVAEASRFTKAKFFIQKDELEFGRNPHSAVVSGYVQEFFEGLNFVVLSGDKKICGGLSDIKTPGHTDGGQPVCIETTKGIVIIPGLCTIRENFEPPPAVSDTMSVIVPTIHTNVLQAYDSLMKIKKMADIVLPLHDTHKNLSDLGANIVKFELPDV